MLTKVCTQCNEELPATFEYYRKMNKGKLGLGSKCKRCISLQNAEYRHKNHNEIIRKQQEYALKHPNKIKASKDKYINANREKHRQSKKRYYSRQKNYVLAQTKKYAENNKEIYRISQQKRRSIKQSLPNNYTREEWNIAQEYFDNKCAYCENDGKLEQEHFIPISKGGEYTINNIIPACRSCNASKSAADCFEWYPKQLFYSKKREQKILKYLNYDAETQTQQLALTI